MEEILLVDKDDNEIGFEEKMKAHEEGGKLHRAFSIFIFNSKGEMLLQLRSKKKYHFGDLWTNTCCSHQRKGEILEQSVHRRLQEEFGFDTGVKEVYKFIYKSTDENSGLTEHEYDHVFIGTFDGEPKPNPEEIDEYKWVILEELEKDVKEHPENYTPWFKIILDKVTDYFKS
ncbi:MAG: isopentenyl-diphosphate Delta-isomerase [Candidatus Aenigmarchaeota archaeon]|nr:isopentenyl-diphosphate Delta-isomerase [Candidatus Aenigmarchaeota archaeon]